MPKLKDRRKIVRELFRGTSGFHLPDEETWGPGGLATWGYGELTATGVHKLLDYLQLSERDVFYDLGSGTGKVVVQAAISVPLKKCIGIELVTARFKQSLPVLRLARKQKLILAGRCGFRNENLLHTDFSDATALYAASTVFSRGLMHAIKRKIRTFNRELRFVSLQEFKNPQAGFELIDVLRLNATWDRRVEANVYRVTPDKK